MMIRRMLALFGMTLALGALIALPVLATEGDEVTQTTVAASDGEGAVIGDLEPAVPVEQEAAADAGLDWTYRYMIPTGILLGVIVIALTAGQYFTQVVRKRYRIVEE